MVFSPGPQPLYACLYQPPAVAGDERGAGEDTLAAVAREFSPRYECGPGHGVVTIDVSGLDRLIGSPRTIGEEVRRDAARRGLHVHVAVAATRTTALVLALARPGLTVVAAGRERETLAPLPVTLLEKARGSWLTAHGPAPEALGLEPVCKRWGIRTLGEFAALPANELPARLGRNAPAWQAMARGEDTVPLVPSTPEERFESSLDLEWPIDGLEPLSFVLTRLLEPLSERLERRDRGTATLHLELRLLASSALGAGTEAPRHERHLQLPSPTRDVRTLRTLLLLDLDAHPPPAAVDRVTIVIDPTPGRVVQHTLYTRAQPTPEQLSTLLARLGALMGQDRVGAPATVDSYRPGAFAITPFATDRDELNRRESQAPAPRPQAPAPSPQPLVSALRRCRQPVPARAVVEDGRPTRVTTDRRGFGGGAVHLTAGPWRTSGHWWNSHHSPRSTLKSDHAGSDERPGAPDSDVRLKTWELHWDRDEWDVTLADGAVYRVFQDRESGGWFIDAVID